MYGELSLSEIVPSNQTVCYQQAGPCEHFPSYRCYFHFHLISLFHIRSNLTLALLAGYMLVGNVMLLNLLIAIFTSVFEEIQANSKEVNIDIVIIIMIDTSIHSKSWGLWGLGLCQFFSFSAKI